MNREKGKRKTKKKKQVKTQSKELISVEVTLFLVEIS
jgi:hypothetical protein